MFLDRDGVLNEELGYQITSFNEFQVKEGVVAGLKKLKEAGFLLIVVTNQSGIVKGTYDDTFVMKCHNEIQRLADNALDDIYFAPGYDSVSKSLSRKPNSLMFERAIAKYKVNTGESWMIGDRESDMIPADKLGIKGLHLTEEEVSSYAKFSAKDFSEAVEIIIRN